MIVDTKNEMKKLEGGLSAMNIKTPRKKSGKKEVHFKVQKDLEKPSPVATKKDTKLKKLLHLKKIDKIMDK